MIRSCMLICLLLVPGIGNAQTVNCATGTTQFELNECAARDARAADDELNRLWKIIKPAADARGQGQALLDAQRAWLRFRDATCEAERAEFEGGSIAPMVYSRCIERLTLERNDDFRAMR